MTTTIPADSYESSIKPGRYGCPVENLSDGAWQRHFVRTLAGRRNLPGDCVVIVGAKTSAHPHLDQYLDEMHDRLSNLVLLHTGDPGIGVWISKWAELRQVSQLILKPDFQPNSEIGEAVFRMMDVFLSFNPRCILNFCTPGWMNGNLTEKARLLGIPVVSIPQIPKRHLTHPDIYGACEPDFSGLPF